MDRYQWLLRTTNNNISYIDTIINVCSINQRRLNNKISLLKSLICDLVFSGFNYPRSIPEINYS